jgi:hypothetical protein
VGGGMTPPIIPASVWLLAAVDPVLIAIAVILGWKADQFGKVFIVAIAALGASVLVSWAISAVGLPWVAPVGGNNPTLLPIRTIAALLWASVAYFARKVVH